MSIPAVQARGIFTKAYMAAYKENVPASSFLKSFFTVKTFPTKSVSIEVQRATERIAVDILRGTTGNRNTFSRSSEKEYIPPFFSESFDATQLDRYDVGFNQIGSAVPQTIGYLASDVAGKLITLREKIERAKEKQCAEVFETGIVTMNNGDNIDYKRKAGSLIDLDTAGDYWSVAGADVDADISAGGDFIRQYGKNPVKELNLVMSGAAYALLKLTDWWSDTANWRRASLMDVKMPMADSTGAVYHGEISAGAYRVHLWTYDEIYEDATSGTITRYLDETKAFLVPVKGTRFELVHAGVPAIIRDVNNAEFSEFIQDQAAEYYINNYIDKKAKSHTFEIYSAPLAIPVTIDQIYTMKVKA
jgi:hypothetical protein